MEANLQPDNINRAKSAKPNAYEAKWARLTKQNIVPELSEELLKIAKQRGELLASYPQDQKAIRKIDGEVFKALSASKKYLRDYPEITEKLFLVFKTSEADSRLAKFEITLNELSEELGVYIPRGYSRKHNNDTEGQSDLESCSRNIRQYITSQIDLLKQFPVLKKMWDQIKDDAIEVGIENRLTAEKSVINIRSSLPFNFGPFKRDGERLWRTLLDCGPDALPHIPRIYEAREGKDLLKLTAKRTNGFDRKRLQNLYSGEYEQALADNIAYVLDKNKSLWRRFLNAAMPGKKIYADLVRAIQAIPDDLTKEVEQSLIERHARHFNGRKGKPSTFREFIEPHVKIPSRIAQLEARMQGDLEVSYAIELKHMVLKGRIKNWISAVHMLEACKDKQINIREGFKRAFPQSDLEDYIKCYIPDKNIQKVILSLLEGNELEARFNKLCYGMSSSKREWIGEAFRDTTADERVWLRQKYHDTFGQDLIESLRSKRTLFLFPLKNLEFIESIIENGKLQPWEKARYAMLGMWTDVELLQSVFEGRSRDEISEIEKKYEEKYYHPDRPFMKFLDKAPLLQKFFFIGKNQVQALLFPQVR